MTHSTQASQQLYSHSLKSKKETRVAQLGATERLCTDGPKDSPSTATGTHQATGGQCQKSPLLG
jgi:hypothetical protein